MDKFTRIGAPWTKEEEHAILVHVASGMRIAEIAIAQKRTSGGIRSRLTRIACQLVEEEKVSVYEASGRTGIRAARIQEALRRKTDEAKAKAECPKPKMDFGFVQTTSREKLLALPLEQKIGRLRSIADEQGHIIARSAQLGKTNYLWEMDEPKFAQYLTQTHRAEGLPITLDEVMEALRARFPGCKVERLEDWVDVPNRQMGQPPTRVLKSGIKIDWA
jgi:hypothetical protein